MRHTCGAVLLARVFALLILRRGRALDARAVDKVELQQGVSAHPRGQRSAGDTHPKERVVLLPAVEAAFGALKDR